MFYRDALTALYSYGGIYAKLVLGWEIIQIGVFGIIAAIAAAILSWVGGIADQRVGPKPVITFCVTMLILVCVIIVGMSRDSLFGIALSEGSTLPDTIFFICGAIIGGAGGALYSASRSLMVRHIDGGREAEAFGLFALSGKATAFLAPALITVFTLWTESNQLGFLPVIFLFLIGMFLLRWVHPDGVRSS
jgi:UMF1 family MFS transporter